MQRDYKGALRLIAITALMGGGYVLGMMLHTFHGWVSSILVGLSVAAMTYACVLLIAEGRARERAERERQPPKP